MRSRESELSKVIVLIIKTGHCFCLEQLRAFLISVSFVHEWSQIAIFLLLLDRSFDHVAVKILFSKFTLLASSPLSVFFTLNRELNFLRMNYMFEKINLVQCMTFR